MAANDRVNEHVIFIPIVFLTSDLKDATDEEAVKLIRAEFDTNYKKALHIYKTLVRR